jgi:hypothetical protein
LTITPERGLADEDLPDARLIVVRLRHLLVTGDAKAARQAGGDFRGGSAVEVAASSERWYSSARRGRVAEPRAENICHRRLSDLGVNWTSNRFIKLQVNAIGNASKTSSGARSDAASGAGCRVRQFASRTRDGRADRNCARVRSNS